MISKELNDELATIHRGLLGIHDSMDVIADHLQELFQVREPESASIAVENLLRCLMDSQAKRCEELEKLFDYRGGETMNTEPACQDAFVLSEAEIHKLHSDLNRAESLALMIANAAGDQETEHGDSIATVAVSLKAQVAEVFDYLDPLSFRNRAKQSEG